MSVTKYFNGLAFAEKQEKHLKEAVSALVKKGRIPKLVSIVVGDEEGALKYQELKKKKAKEIGATVEIVKIPAITSMNRFIEVINKANNDGSVHGVMVQLPLPKVIRNEQPTIINAISPKKDVDGMRDDSPFVAPVVLAVGKALTMADKDGPCHVVVVGGKGFVGGMIVKYLWQTHKSWTIEGLDLQDDLQHRLREADVVISAVGQKDLIKPEMVKKGVVLIDVGAPDGDVGKEAYEKANFVSPVPGGVGPVTVHHLLANLIKAVK